MLVGVPDIANLLSVFLSFEGLLDKVTQHSKKHPYESYTWASSSCTICEELTLNIEYAEQAIEETLGAYVDKRIEKYMVERSAGE